MKERERKDRIKGSIGSLPNKRCLKKTEARVKETTKKS